MARTGRPPKPTSIKILEGNPGKGPLPQNEPKPVPIAPACPKWLNSEARKMWRQLAPELERLGVLTSVDGQAFAALCQAYGTWVQCERYMAKHGRTYEHVNTKGAANIIERPESKIAHKALAEFRAMCSEFGITPASRTRIEVSATNSLEDEMELLLETMI